MTLIGQAGSIMNHIHDPKPTAFAGSHTDQDTADEGHMLVFDGYWRAHDIVLYTTSPA